MANIHPSITHPSVLPSIHPTQNRNSLSRSTSCEPYPAPHPLLSLPLDSLAAATSHARSRRPRRRPHARRRRRGRRPRRAARGAGGGVWPGTPRSAAARRRRGPPRPPPASARPATAGRSPCPVRAGGAEGAADDPGRASDRRGALRRRTLVPAVVLGEVREAPEERRGQAPQPAAEPRLRHVHPNRPPREAHPARRPPATRRLRRDPRRRRHAVQDPCHGRNGFGRFPV